MELAEQRYQHWCAQKTLDPELRQELAAMQNDADKITDAFYRDLEFGTAGLRGVLGAGTNRMNIYVIRRATQAVADYLTETDLPKTVAIGHDSRSKSDVFAREAAAVFAANGITAYLYPRLEPVPALSFAVRHLHCGPALRQSTSFRHNSPLTDTIHANAYSANVCRSRFSAWLYYTPPLWLWQQIFRALFCAPVLCYNIGAKGHTMPPFPCLSFHFLYRRTCYEIF